MFKSTVNFSHQSVKTTREKAIAMEWMRAKWTILRARHLNNNGKWNRVTMATIIAVWTKLHNTCSNRGHCLFSFFPAFLLWTHRWLKIIADVFVCFVLIKNELKLKHNVDRSLLEIPRNWWQFCQKHSQSKVATRSSSFFVWFNASEKRDTLLCHCSHFPLNDFESPWRESRWKRCVRLCDHSRWHAHSIRHEGRLSANFNGIE